MEDRKIDYLIADGFAVNFHYVQRSTVDLDLILHLTESNIFSFLGLMNDLGFVPQLPVKAEDLADPEIRRSWIAEKNMMVFSFVHRNNPVEIIDIFIQEPKPFDDLYSNRKEVPFGDIALKVIGKADLIEMKEKAGRPKDLYDISELRKLNQWAGSRYTITLLHHLLPMNRMSSRENSFVLRSPTGEKRQS